MLKLLDKFTRTLSHSWGELAKIEKPYPFVQRVIREYARIYSINLEEIEKPIGAYKSLSDFFTRRLKSGIRPIKGEYVHPCDGVLLGRQNLSEKGDILVKGRSYSVDEFIPNNPWASDLPDMHALVYYLSPKDYHRFHSPIEATIKWSLHVPGGLYPVNDLGFKFVKNLYTVNERVVLGLESKSKRFFLSFVGATNVGSIVLPWDETIRTNFSRKTNFKEHDIKVAVGEELGYFDMGSSIVFLLPEDIKMLSKAGPVKVGELL